jgi:hypothetical protein
LPAYLRKFAAVKTLIFKGNLKMFFRLPKRQFHRMIVSKRNTGTPSPQRKKPDKPFIIREKKKGGKTASFPCECP